MNRIAGIVGRADEEQSYRSRVMSALGGDDVHLVNPAPGVIIGWSGDSGLVAVARNGERFVAFFGSGYADGGAQTCRGAIDDASSWAQKLLEEREGHYNIPSHLLGAYVIVSCGGASGVMVYGDPSGLRTPYLSVRGEELAFSSHPLICARLLPQATLNREYEDFLLIYGFFPDGYTVYEGVRALPPGKMYWRRSDSWQLISIEKRVYRGVVPSVSSSADDLSDQLYEVMLDCLRDQLPTSDEVGVFLGGFDSALVASMLKRLGKRVRTYSFRYMEDEYNQPHVESVAKHVGGQHRWVDISPEVVEKGIEEYAKMCTQPSNWLNYIIQSVHVGKQMRRDGIEFAFSGDGCDTLFLGYPGTYRRTYAYARLPQLPEMMVSVLVGMFGWKSLDRWIGHPYRVAMGLVRAMGRPMPARAFITFRVMDEITLRALRSNVAYGAPVNTEATLRELAESCAGLSLQRLGYAAKSLVSPNKAKLAAITDVSGIRVNSPYLHPQLKQFTASIPDDALRLPQHRDVSDPGKLCLARMAERYMLLPQEVIYQPKLAAIDSPIDAWFSSSLKKSVFDAVGGLPFEIDLKQMESMIKTSRAERFYKRNVGSTRVISDAVSLLVTYGAMASAIKP